MGYSPYSTVKILHIDETDLTSSFAMPCTAFDTVNGQWDVYEETIPTKGSMVKTVRRIITSTLAKGLKLVLENRPPFASGRREAVVVLDLPVELRNAATDLVANEQITITLKVNVPGVTGLSGSEIASAVHLAVSALYQPSVNIVGGHLAITSGSFSAIANGTVLPFPKG